MAFTLTPALADDFVGRKEITSELVNQLSSRNKIGYSLSGVRRIGKTSILKEVERRLTENRKVPVAYVSVWRVSPNTIDEFVRVANRAALNAFRNRLPAKFKFEELLVTGKAALTRFLNSLKLSAKVADDLEVSISYVRREASDVDDALTGCFSLIEHLGEMTRTNSVLIVDEFPSLVDLTYGAKNQKIGDSMIKLIRSEIEPFSESEYKEFLQHYLPGLKFTRDAVREQLYRITSGIPYNLQLLGSEIQLQGLNDLSSGKLSGVVDGVLRKEGELSFKEFVDDLTPSEVKVLRALARSSDIKPSGIAAQQFMDKDTVGYSLSLLVNKGIIVRRGRGAYVFPDNLFGEWLKSSDDL